MNCLGLVGDFSDSESLLCIGSPHPARLFLVAALREKHGEVFGSRVFADYLPSRSVGGCCRRVGFFIGVEWADGEWVLLGPVVPSGRCW